MLCGKPGSGLLLAAVVAVGDVASAASPAASAVPTEQPCLKNLDGPALLSIAHERGITPSSNCLLADLAANKFYAPPDKSCSVRFSADSWLAKDWHFVRLTGVGSFETTAQSDSLVVNIEARGGFVVKTITVKASATMHASECAAAKLSEIVR